jgi:NAD+ synthase
LELTPLSGLKKQQGRFLLRFLGADERISTKPPTADLLDLNPGQLDEDELNLSYQMIDDYLEGKEVPDEVAQQIEKRYRATEHKRHAPVTPFDTWWKTEGDDESFHHEVSVRRSQGSPLPCQNGNPRHPTVDGTIRH